MEITIRIETDAATTYKFTSHEDCVTAIKMRGGRRDGETLADVSASIGVTRYDPFDSIVKTALALRAMGVNVVTTIHEDDIEEKFGYSNIGALKDALRYVAESLAMEVTPVGA